MIAEHTRAAEPEAVRDVLSLFRKHIEEKNPPPEINDIVAQVQSVLLRNESDRIRPVVNATGTILHTGAGRAVLPQQAVDALFGLNRCCNMQIDMETGKRGKHN